MNFPFHLDLKESIYRRIKERQLREQELEIQRQNRTFRNCHSEKFPKILWHVAKFDYLYSDYECFLNSTEAQQYHVYTLQPLTNPMQSSPISSILSQQQQQYIHQQQELKGTI